MFTLKPMKSSSTQFMSFKSCKIRSNQVNFSQLLLILVKLIHLHKVKSTLGKENVIISVNDKQCSIYIKFKSVQLSLCQFNLSLVSIKINQVNHWFCSSQFNLIEFNSTAINSSEVNCRLANSNQSKVNTKWFISRYLKCL